MQELLLDLVSDNVLLRTESWGLFFTLRTNQGLQGLLHQGKMESTPVVALQVVALIRLVHAL